MAYVIGYQSGTYGGYEPFKGVEVGDYYNQTETVTVPNGGHAEEVFAGAEIFLVENGVISGYVRLFYPCAGAGKRQ